MLAVLALDGATARDTLAAWLWPDVPLKTANLSLRQRIFRLRRRTSHDLVRTGLALALADGVVVDLEGPGAELLAGMVYADCPLLADWLRLQRERRTQARHETLARAAAAHETAGELASAIDTAQALLSELPLSEHALRRLMRLHYLRGDRATAIALFERFERHLKDELGARPDTETLALLASVEATPGAPAIQRVHAQVPASLLRPPRLVGRETELATLSRAWQAGAVFLVLGEAGMGKSRLLAEFVSQRPRAVAVQARPGDAGVPFALLARLLRALNAQGQPVLDSALRSELARFLPELGSGLPAVGEGQRLVLQGALQQWLQRAADAGTHELILDDLHFADAASLEMLEALVGMEGLSTLRWGLAQRPGEGSAAAALQSALLETQGLQAVNLGHGERFIPSLLEVQEQLNNVKIVPR